MTTLTDIAVLFLKSDNNIELAECLLGEALFNTELTNMCQTPIKGTPAPDERIQTLSRALAKGDHAEFNRTMYSILLLKALIAGNEAAFPSLSPEKFQDFQRIIHACIGNENRVPRFGEPILAEYINKEKLGMLIAVLVCHDVGKIEENIECAKKIAQDKGYTLTAGDDDAIILILSRIAIDDPLAVAPLLPFVSQLNKEGRVEFSRAFSTKVNPGRIAQLEGTPDEFSALVPQQDNRATDFALFKAYHCLDMAGIWGFKEDIKHPGNPCFWSIISDIASLAFHVAGQVASGQLTPQKAYQKVVNNRAFLFGLNPADPVEHAAIRLAAMRHTRSLMIAGNRDGDQIKPMDIVAFLRDNKGSNTWKIDLVNHLNRGCRNEGKPAITVGFAPDVGDKIAQKCGNNVNEFLELWLRSIYCVQRAVIQKAGEEGRSKESQLTVELQPILKAVGDTPDALIYGELELQFDGSTYNATGIVIPPKITDAKSRVFS